MTDDAPATVTPYRFIIRIDDCGWNPAKEPDRRLEYFQAWRSAAGLDELPIPIVYGFIPATVTALELEILREIIERREQTRAVAAGRGPVFERVAVHGWTHAENAVVTVDQMATAWRTFAMGTRTNYERAPAQIYIPPFNRYDAATIKRFSESVEKFNFHNPRGTYGVFLGGFVGDEQSAQYGAEPIVVSRNVIHVPAVAQWYGSVGRKTVTSGALIDAAREIGPPVFAPGAASAWHAPFDVPPTVLTLHVTWDDKYFGKLREFFELIGPHAVDVTYAAAWLRDQGRCAFDT